VGWRLLQSIKAAKRPEGTAEQAVGLEKKGHAEKSQGRAGLKDVEEKLKNSIREGGKPQGVTNGTKRHPCVCVCA
jgi:hypothetical protein